MSIPLHIIFELFALISGVALYKRLNQKFKPLVWFLVFILITEVSGLYIGRELKKSNHTLYNFTSPISFIFYFYFFRSLIHSAQWKKFILWVVAIFITFSITNLLLWQGFNFFNSYTMMFGSLVMILLCGILLLELIELTTLEKKITNFPEFYLAIGLLFSFTGTLLYWVIFNLNWDSNAIYFQWMIKSQVYVRYFFIAISFLCFYKPTFSKQTLL
jgi:hypothetical protein